MPNSPFAPHGFCRQCTYPLQHLTAADGVFRCPECGRAFDPSDPLTFRVHRHGRVIRWLARPVGWPLVVLAVLGAIGVLCVSRWRWNSFNPSTVDIQYYLRPAALRHRTNLTTWRDVVYTVSMLAIGAAMTLWILRVTLGIFARRRAGAAMETPVHLGRRRMLIALASAGAAAGALLGWPFRLGQQWVARQIAAMKQGRSLLYGPGGNPAPPPVVMSNPQKLVTLRAAVMEMPQAKQRMAGLKILMEQETPLAMPILLDAVVSEPDSAVRALELRLIGLHRQEETADVLAGFLNHADAHTRAAAVDAVGILHAPAFPVPLDWNAMNLGGEPAISEVPIELWPFLNQIGLRNPTDNDAKLNVELIPLPTALRDAVERIAIDGPTAEEREAAGRALLRWPPENYSLRYAEWGVWIDDAGALKLMKSLLDEIPPFVHRTGNPMAEFRQRVNDIMFIDKPVIHLTTDRLMAVDIDVKIRHGRPWFAYPKPDDFSVRSENPRWSVITAANGSKSWVQPPPLLVPLDNAALGKLDDMREGFPWLAPAHRMTGLIDGGMGDWDEIQTMGCRWQSLIVSPRRLAWMQPPEVGSDAKYQWWNMLRDVPCSWLSNRGEAERFIYYDGPTLAPAPVRVSLAGQNLRFTFTAAADAFFNFSPRIDSLNRTPRTAADQDIKQSPDYPGMSQLSTPDKPRRGLLIRVSAGRVGGQIIAIPASEIPKDKTDLIVDVPLASDDLHDDVVSQALHTMLISAGLKAHEADGLIRCWRPQFFQTDGVRFLLILSAHDYDTFCPLWVRPRPTELARVGIVLTELSSG